MLKLDKHKTFTVDKDVEVTAELITKAIKLHREELVDIYVENEDMYLSDHDILYIEKKESHKPDNRLVINIPKYIVDTFEGYRMGVPPKTKHEDETVDAFINEFERINDTQDVFAETSKGTSIYGHAFWYVYQDEETLTRVAYETPVNMFIVYDDTVQQKPMFAVRYATNDNGKVESGEVITNQERIEIMSSESGIALTEAVTHIYDEMPVIEVTANNERQGVFDSVKTLINALNKAISEKANDVDYFADAYIHIDGQELSEENGDKVFRDNRLVNTWGEGPVTVKFLEKPDADDTQENLISHLWEMIFVVSMVANLSDEDFGTSSGVALQYRLQAMNNLAKAKDRKFENALHRLFKVVFSVPKIGVYHDDYINIDYQFTRNLPNNLKEEAEIVSLLSGEVSEETKFKALSLITDAEDEIERIQEEQEYEDDYFIRRELESRNKTDGELNEQAK